MTPRHSLSAHLFAYEPLAQSHLRAASEEGFACVELWSMAPNFDVESGPALGKLSGWLRELSLRAVSFHAPFYADLEAARSGRWLSLAAPERTGRREALKRTEAALRAFRPLGAQIAVLHPCAPSTAGQDDTYEGLRESVEHLLPLAEEMDAHLALENIPAHLGRAEPMAAFVEEISHPRLGVCLDAGHLMISEENQFSAALRRLAPMSVSTHLHDNDGKTDAHLIPGEGKLAWPELIGALESSGYRGPLTYEVRRRDEPYADTIAKVARAAGAMAPETLLNAPEPK